MPARAVLAAVLAAVVVCTASGIVMETSGVDPALVIIGSVIFGVATLFAVALLFDELTRRR
jgi:hypothetical protein